MASAELYVLMVAEKPSIAEALTRALAGAGATKRMGVSPRSPVHEYVGSFQGEPAHFRVTSTAGHIYNLDFDKEFNDWQKHGPEELFSATLQNMYDGHARLPEHLQAEANGCHALVLWLDCDREGENICFEVIRNSLPVMDDSRCFPGAFRDRVFRAKFSSLVPSDLQRAMADLSVPNLNESLSVDARREIDLRLGVAFSRFQTQYFRKHFTAQLGSAVRTVTYGPCQMPTLWFCVHRHCQIEAFVPEPFWRLSAEVCVAEGGQTFPAEAACGPLWDLAEAEQHLQRSRGASTVTLGPVAREARVWRRPLPLNTVALLRSASERIGMSPGDAMYYAEQLYLKGILSYPRTETNKYPENFDLDATVRLLQSPSAPWSEVAGEVLTHRVEPRQDGTDYGDHPPITPVKLATPQQCKDEWAWELYKLVCEHFLATVSPDCNIHQATARLDLGGLTFQARSVKLASGNFTWCRVTGDVVEETPFDLASLPGEVACTVKDAKLTELSTQPPPYLSESELLELMERHGIGTDASMAQHISNIVKRGYVWLDEATRQLRPEPMGLALLLAYTLVDPGLAQPTVRAAIENECDLIAQGKAMKNDVVRRVLRVFERKFHAFRRRVDRVPAMLAVAYAQQLGRASEGEAVQQWRAACKIVAAVKLEDLLQSRESIALEEEAQVADDSGEAEGEDQEERQRAIVSRVQLQLDELGFQASRDDEEGVSEPQAKRPRKTFAPDPNKNSLQNFNELCQRLGVQSKVISHPPEVAGFRCKIELVLADGASHEFISAQPHGKKKAAEHDAAAVALAQLLELVG